MAAYFFPILLWIVLVLFDLSVCYNVAILSAMTMMFPEGRRPWHIFAEIGAFILTGFVAIACPLIKVTLA
jgi:hypothetical protein